MRHLNSYFKLHQETKFNFSNSDDNLKHNSNSRKGTEAFERVKQNAIEFCIVRVSVATNTYHFSGMLPSHGRRFKNTIFIKFYQIVRFYDTIMRIKIFHVVPF